jgi:3alpha(or 20beta)-hydroxysteroid dehydrogenase
VSGARFTRSVVLISGAARGQGAAEARAFAAEGANVVLGDILDAECHAAAGAIGDAASSVHLDVTDEASWREAVDHVESRHGRLDVLVNNAGIVSFASVADVEPAEFRRVMDVNVTGTLLGIKSCTPLLIRSGGGSIVNISSISGLKGAAESAAYVASKWAVRGLTKAAAVDLASQGIRVNSVHPGVIDTPLIMRPGSSRDEILARHLPRLLVPRLGTPDDVVPLVLFLASREAAYVTGAEFVVDGGWTVR